MNSNEPRGAAVLLDIYRTETGMGQIDRLVESRG